MPQAKIDGLLFKEMIQSGAALLTQNRESVDALNVFPVPDGDTGTNMSQTDVYKRQAFTTSSTRRGRRISCARRPSCAART